MFLLISKSAIDSPHDIILYTKIRENIVLAPFSARQCLVFSFFWLSFTINKSKMLYSSFVSKINSHFMVYLVSLLKHAGYDELCQKELKTM